MIYFLLLTSLTVSIDSLVCGFSLSLIKPKKLPIVLGITLIVLLMCLATNYLAKLLSNVITEKTAGFGGLILVGVGIYNLFSKQEKTVKERKSLNHQIMLSGFAVGLDGAIANLSLSIMGINAFYVPLTIAFFHGVMIFIGVSLCDIPLISKLNKYSFIAPLILIILGLYKFSSIFY